MTHNDNITSLRTGVLCLPYNVESAEIGPPAVKGEVMSWNELHESRTTPWSLPGRGALKGGC